MKHTTKATEIPVHHKTLNRSLHSVFSTRYFVLEQSYQTFRIMGATTMVQPNAPQTEQLERTDFLHHDKTEVQVIEEGQIFEETQDPVAKELERKLKWKLDLFILPLISAVYFFASMVRQPLCPPHQPAVLFFLADIFRDDLILETHKLQEWGKS